MCVWSKDYIFNGCMFRNLYYIVINNFRYNECFDMYRDIIKQSKDSFANERESNLTAVISQLSKLGDVSCLVHS